MVRRADGCHSRSGPPALTHRGVRVRRPITDEIRELVLRLARGGGGSGAATVCVGVAAKGMLTA
jgi:hypothetical protein